MQMIIPKKKTEESTTKNDMGLLDAGLMQGLQDRFCSANNLYLVCLSRKYGVITKAYGSKEELDYLHKRVDMNRHVSLLNKLISNQIESVVEEDCGYENIKMSGVSIRVDGDTAAIWVVIGVIREKSGSELPDYIMTTTEESYYKSLGFLEALSKQMFAVKMDELLAQEAFLKSKESEEQMEVELRRNEVMTSIVRMLESEEGFTQIVDNILDEVCDYLKIPAASLIRENHDETYEMICEYVKEQTASVMETSKQVPKEEIPFFTGKPYLLSSDSMMPEEFRNFFAKRGITAGIFLPIEVNDKTTMYVCFLEKGKERLWEISEVKFLNDVKRIIQSILTKRITKNSLASSYASLEAILENVGCGICVRDPSNGTILYTNQRFRTAFAEVIAQRKLDAIIPREYKDAAANNVNELYLEESNRWFDIHNTMIHWVDGREVMLCTIYDVTDKKLYQQKIQNQADHDFLTGLYNRMRCEEDLKSYIAQAKEFGGEGALLYIDLDDFKHINDGLGHQYGDVLLKSIASSLQQISGVENNCYRMGGDEFIVIVAHYHYTMLNRILNEIRTIFTKPWLLKGADYYCTMSMGVVRFPTDGDTVEELIKKADIAMYGAKCSGKNRIESYDDNVEATSFKRLDLEKNMRNATRNACGEFEVYYQPLVDVTRPGNPCYGAEALIRWNSPELGFVTPAEFIPLAEYLGLINPIGTYVLEEACKRCKYWNDLGHPEYKVNVNLSVVQLLQKDIVRTIALILEKTRLNPQNLTLEVTESLAIHDMERMKEILSKIKQLGVNVALDDFGTGYSSLNHIREMPIDMIKIDRCFILDIGKDEFSDAFVRMVAELANTIGVKVCVEGVEEEEQLAALKQTKIQLIQGFYFGKPMCAKEFEEIYL